MNLKAGLLLALLLLQGIFLGLGLKPMDKTQEVRVAETAREMVETGDWLIPRLNGELRLRKPPLAYWLTATSYSAFGSANEFTARFASAVFAALTVVVIFFWAKKSLGIESALTISVCLVSSYLALRYFRSAETDAILLFFVTAACVIAHQILFEAPTNARVVALYASMGLGFLAKGPAAVVIPLVLLIAFALLKKRHSALRKLINPAGIGLFFVIAFVWYAVIFKTLPDAVSYWVAEELDASFVTGKYHEPFLWYFYSAFSFFLPWSLFIVPAAIWLYKTRPPSAPVQFALAWLLLTLLVLTLNPSKQIQYALLLTPPLMIVIGHYLAASEGNYRRINVAIAAMVVIAATALFAVRIIKWRELGSLSLTPLALLAAGTLLPVLIAAKMQLRLLRSVVLLAGLVTAGYVYAQRYIHEELGERVAVRDFVAKAKEYSPLFTYAAGNPRLSFYMQRVIPALTDESKLRGPLDEPVYVVVEGLTPEWQLPASLVLKHDRLELWKVLPRSDGTPK